MRCVNVFIKSYAVLVWRARKPAAAHYHECAIFKKLLKQHQRLQTRELTVTHACILVVIRLSRTKLSETGHSILCSEEVV